MGVGDNVYKVPLIEGAQKKEKGAIITIIKFYY